MSLIGSSKRSLALTVLHSFLDDISRITKLRYEPTSDDVVRARLRTMGVQEYSFISEKVEKENIAAGLLGYGSKKPTDGDPIKRSGPLGIEPGREWIIYDVGGARSNVSTKSCVCLVGITEHRLLLPEASMAAVLYCPQCHHFPCTHLML